MSKPPKDTKKRPPQETRPPESSVRAPLPPDVERDPQDIYDQSIAEYEEDGLREAQSEPANEPEPGTSSARQAQRPPDSPRDKAARAAEDKTKRAKE